MKTIAAVIMFVIGIVILGLYFLLGRPAQTQTVQSAWPYSQKALVYYLPTAQFDYVINSASQQITITDKNGSKLQIAGDNSSDALASIITGWSGTPAADNSGTVVTPANCTYLRLVITYPYDHSKSLQSQMEQASCVDVVPDAKNLDSFQGLTG